MPSEDLDLIASVGTMVEANEVIASQSIDILLTDLDLPDGSGIDLIHKVHKLPSVTALVITVFGDEKHVLEAIKAGASGYLLKDGGAEDIAKAIMDMQNGGSPISPSIARYLLKHFRSKTSPQVEIDANKPSLTVREKEVIELIAKGFTYSEIAKLLGLSVHTVTSHIKNTYKKLSVSSRGEAVYEAMQLGLIHMEAE
jgi:DNA-binding NarL/FixJ family response regulator